MPDILARRDGPLLVLTFDNEPKRNAFTHAMTEKLGRLLAEAEDDPSVRCVLLTGAGNRAFSSGHDLNEMMVDRDHAADEALNAPFTAPARMATPTVAVVNGAAHAGGLILALSCDIRVCEPHADFAAPGARLGLLPIGGQISRLPALVPLGFAFEMLATGRRVGAEEATRMGFVNHLAGPGGAMEKGLEVARTIAGNSASVIAAIKTGLDAYLREGPDAARSFEWREGQRLQSGADAEEGLRAFLEKRDPSFQ